MPKFPTLTPKKLLKILQQEGFVVDRATGSHYILFCEITRKRVTVPYYTKDIPKGTLFSIIKYSGIDIKKFK